jgi:O-antigen/teichoic acid export membrane protein
MRRSFRLDMLIVAALFVLPLAFFWQVTLGNRTLLPADNLYQFQPWAAYRAQVGVPAVPHNSLLSDLVLENLPWKQFIRQSIANRELPLWNPYIFAGVPFLAAGQHSALYPFSVIYYVLPLDKAYGWFTVSQLWLAGVFMYLFMRGLGVRRFGATLAAVAYQMSGFFIASVVFQMIIAAAAWLPFLLLMVEFTIRQRPLLGRPTVIPWVALGALGLGTEILAGHVEFTYYTLLVMGFWSACRLGGIGWGLVRKEPHPPTPSPTGEGEKAKKGKWRRAVIKPAAALVALVVLGVGVGAVQFIPMLELASHNFREGSASLAEVRGYAYPPRHALAFLMPNLFGSPAEHDYFDVFSGQQTAFNWKRADGSTVTDTYWEVGKNYVEGACYVGLLTLVLAALALINARFEKTQHARIVTEGPYRAILAALALISILFVFGTVAYAVLYYGLPGINQLHSPFRWVFPLTLCLAALAGFGAEALQRAGDLPHPLPPPMSTSVPLRREGEPEGAVSAADSPLHQSGEGAGVRQDSLTRRVARWMGWALVGSGGAVLVGLVLSRVFFERLRGPLDNLFHKLAGADTAFPNVETFYSVEFRSILIFGVFLVACGVVIRMSRGSMALPRRLGRVPEWQALALAVLALDLVIASAGFNPAADPKWLEFEPPAITWLKQHNPQEWRFTAVEGPTHTMNANVGWLYGLQDIRGYDSMIPKQYVEYMRKIQPQTQLIYNRIAPIFPDRLDALDSPLLDLLGVKYVVSEIEIDTRAHSKYRQVYQDEAVRIYENTQAKPRAYTAEASSFSLCETSDQSCSFEPIPESKGTRLAITEASINQIKLDVTIAGNGVENAQIREHNKLTILILADATFTGWRAYIRPQGTSDDQEKETTYLPLYGIFRGVALAPGAWTIRFRFSPPSFQVGAFATFIALAVIVFVVLTGLWRRFYTEDATEAGSVRRFAKNSLAPIILNLFIRGIDFVFALIMLRILGPADAGTYYYAVVIFGWFDTLTNFGLNLLLTREVARDRSAAGRFLLNSSLLRLALAALGVPLLIVFLAVRSAISPADSVAMTAIILLYVGLVPNSISYGLTALFYAFEKAELPAAVGTVTAILKAVFGLAVLLLGWGVIGLAGVSILLNVITLVIMGWQARGLLVSTSPPSPLSASREGEGSQHPPQPRPVPPRQLEPMYSSAGSGGEVRAPIIDRALIVHMISASWPLMLNNLLASLFFKIDVTLLEPLKGSEIVGKYSAAYKWIDAIGLIPSLFTMALLPIMSRQAHEDRAALQRNYHFAVKLLFMLALPIAVGTTFVAPTLIAILGGQRFVDVGAESLQLMIWFLPVGWINSLTNYVLVALDLQRAMRWAFLAGVLFNVIANLIFIPLFSYQAAAIITIFSELVLQIAFYRLLRTALDPVPWVALLWKPCVAGLVMFAALAVCWPLMPILALVIATLLYPAALLILRPFSEWELGRVAALLPVRVRRFVQVEAGA